MASSFCVCPPSIFHEHGGDFLKIFSVGLEKIRVDDHDLNPSKKHENTDVGKYHS